MEFPAQFPGPDGLIDCGACQGTGYKGSDDCYICHGKGYLRVSTQDKEA